MSNILWLPDHPGELFCVEAGSGEGDFSIEAMLDINNSAFEWMKGTLDMETYLEVLDHYGINPIEFVESRVELYFPRL
jgi:hypothetical protein